MRGNAFQVRKCGIHKLQGKAKGPQQSSPGYWQRSFLPTQDKPGASPNRQGTVQMTAGPPYLGRGGEQYKIVGQAHTFLAAAPR